MTDFEWKEFIIELNQTDKKVDLKKECKARGVGLNTLYRKVNSLKETDSEIFNEFIKKHPYSPRDISTIDFGQLMRESIICGVSQKDLENKYGVPKRTIQRKFRKIHDENPELFNLYQNYLMIDSQEKLMPIIEKALVDYEKQEPLNEEKQLEKRKNDFLDRIKVLQDENPKGAKKQAIQHYEEEIQRIDNQININNESDERE